MTDRESLKEIQRKIFDLTLALYRVTDFFPQGEALKKSLREKANEIFGLVSEYEHSDREEQHTTLILARIQAINGFLEIARSLRFVRPINITVLEREYGFIAYFFEKEFEVEHKREEPETNVETKPERIPESPPVAIKAEIKEEPLPTWEEFSSDLDQVQDSAGVEYSSTPVEQAQAGKEAGEKQPESDLSPIQKDLNDRQKVILEHLKGSKQAKVSDFYSFFSGISTKTIQRDLQDLVWRSVLKKDGERRWTIYSIMDVL